MSEVFISYSRSDLWTMRFIQQLLSKHGINVWSDEKMEPGTPSWQSAIGDAIEACLAVVVIFSETAKDSQWVREELNYAKLHEKEILPLLAAGNETSAIPFGYSATQYIDIRPKADIELAEMELMRKLSKIIPHAVISWHKTANLYWAAHDLSYMRNSPLTSSKSSWLQTLRQASHHLRELNFEEHALKLRKQYNKINELESQIMPDELNQQTLQIVREISSSVREIVNSSQPDASLFSDID